MIQATLRLFNVIHWTNTKTRRIDLDLSLFGVSGKIGWDADYRSK